MAQIKSGTVNVTNGSATVTGVGTTWLTDGAAPGGVFVRQGDEVVYRIASVTSNTQLTLTAVYGGASGSGLAYSITMEQTPNLNLPLLAPGSIGTVPIFNEAVVALDGIGGTVGDLGTAAFRDVMTSLTDTSTPNALMPRGAFGVGRSNADSLVILSDVHDINAGGDYYVTGSTDNIPPATGSYQIKAIASGGVNNNLNILAFRDSATQTLVYTKNRNAGVWSPWRELYHTGNTIVDANGFIKVA